MKLKPREPYIHLLIWGVIFFLTYQIKPVKIEPLTYGDGSMLAILLGGALFNAGVFYATALRFFPLWQARGFHWRSVLEPALLVGVVVACKLFLLLFFFHTLYPHDEIPEDLLVLLPFAQILMTSMFIVFGVTYRLARDRIEHERIRKELEHRRLASELAFLKIQVNPHFLFNTLNNLYGLATREGARATAQSVLELADMMRYMLHESGEHLQPLERELECLASYVALQKLRIPKNRDVNIDLRIDGPVATARIPPMMLLPLVENAFKYGISFKECSEIIMVLTVDKEAVRFRVENTVHPKDEKLERDSGGIGLENLRRRLALMYPGEELFRCWKKDQRYFAELVLPGNLPARGELRMCPSSS